MIHQAILCISDSYQHYKTFKYTAEFAKYEVLRKESQ